MTNTQTVRLQDGTVGMIAGTDADILGKIKTDGDGCDYTGRLIPGDENFEYPEWQENGTLDSVPVAIYYRTTPQDAEMAAEHDWGYIDWEDRIDRIVINRGQCDSDEIAEGNINAVAKKYGIAKF